MREQYQRQQEAQQPALDTTVSAPTKLPIVVSARPGLAGVESALMRRLPTSYNEKTVRDVLGYIVESDVKDSEAATATSLRNELGAAGSVIVINGKNAKLTDRVDQYLVNKTKDIGGKEILYQELEIEVSAVQQGGYRVFY